MNKIEKAPQIESVTTVNENIKKIQIFNKKIFEIIK